jgi:hypothetical protein
MRSQEVYIGQMADRISEAGSIRKALMVRDSAMMKLKPTGHTGAARPNVNDMGEPRFCINSQTTLDNDFIWLGSIPTDVHPLVINWFHENWEYLTTDDNSVSDSDDSDLTNPSRNVQQIDCWTEFVTNGIRYTCHPNYQSDGPIYDFAKVAFQFINTDQEAVYPGRILCFFRHPRTHQILVLVNLCANRTGKEEDRKRKKHSMKLCERRELESTVIRKRSSKCSALSKPKLVASVADEALMGLLRVAEESPGVIDVFEGTNRRGIWVIKDRKKE